MHICHVVATSASTAAATNSFARCVRQSRGRTGNCHFHDDEVSAFHSAGLFCKMLMTYSVKGIVPAATADTCVRASSSVCVCLCLCTKLLCILACVREHANANWYYARTAACDAYFYMCFMHASTSSASHSWWWWRWWLLCWWR